MNAEIRPATVADVPALVALVEQYWAFEAIAHFDRTRVSRVLSRALSDAGLMSGWVARVNGEAVAYLLAAYVFSLEHLGLTAEIDEFYVLPGARGRGLGNRLLQLAEAEFRARGCTNVFLQIGTGNDGARVFYRANGFAERAGFQLLDKMLPGR
jgi:ribosomal protein S18 acetylase RimI-like enzyme